MNNNACLENYSPIDEIKYLRKGNFTVDTDNRNRYAIVVKEAIGKTAYCFGTPIYNAISGKLVLPKFQLSHHKKTYDGSNCHIEIENNLVSFEKQQNSFKMAFDEQINIYPNKSNYISAIPTLNGIQVVVKDSKVKFQLNADCTYSYVKANSVNVSIMKDMFLPIVSISALYALSTEGKCYPVEMQYSELSNDTYEIVLFSSHNDSSIFFEVNFYEQKLFSDTTVESINPLKNNAFGGIAFIGHTEEFGEQWLYSRLDISKLYDFKYKSINSIKLHIPLFNQTEDHLYAFIPTQRFCSFGSTWQNKVEHNDVKLKFCNNKKYLTVDVSDVFAIPQIQELTYNEGLVIRKLGGNDNYTAIATCDNYSRPQILEIKYT